MEDEREILTLTEKRVAELLAWGATYKEIPFLLHEKYGMKVISVRTVVSHVQNIFAKLNISKVNELSAWWFIHYEGVDSSHSPFKRRVRERFYSVILLVIIIPQIANLDQAIRPQRGQSGAMIERVMRSGRRARTRDYYA